MSKVEKAGVVLAAILAFVFVSLMVVGIAQLVVDTARSAYVAPVLDYPYSVGGHVAVIFCKSVDQETRTATDCVRGNPYFLGFKIEKYQLAPLDNWVKRQ